MRIFKPAATRAPKIALKSGARIPRVLVPGLFAVTALTAVLGFAAEAHAGYYTTVCNAYSCWTVYVPTCNLYGCG
jgi:hypothetical protein